MTDIGSQVRFFLYYYYFEKKKTKEKIEDLKQYKQMTINYLGVLKFQFRIFQRKIIAFIKQKDDGQKYIGY